MSISVQELEKIRLNFKLRRKINKITFFLIPAIGIPLMVYAKQDGFGDNSELIFILSLGVVMINFIRNIVVWAYTSIKFEKLFKEGVLEELVHSLLPNIHYDSKGKISSDTFFASQLLKKKTHGSLSGSDYFTGNFGNINFEISLLNYKKLSTEHIHKKQGHIERDGSLFTGVFMVATLKKATREPVYIFPKIRSANKTINALMEKVNFNHLPNAKEIELSDLGIEGKFAVLCNDIQEAKKYLFLQLLTRCCAYINNIRIMSISPISVIKYIVPSIKCIIYSMFQ